LIAWLQARRLAPVGPMREVFLQFGTRVAEDDRIPHAYLVDRPDDFVTEMQIPVRENRRPGADRAGVGRRRK
jgi:hypothetical protein